MLYHRVRAAQVRMVRVAHTDLLGRHFRAVTTVLLVSVLQYLAHTTLLSALRIPMSHVAVLVRRRVRAAP